jgi:hypothetical protein
MPCQSAAVPSLQRTGLAKIGTHIFQTSKHLQSVSCFVDYWRTKYNRHFSRRQNNNKYVRWVSERQTGDRKYVMKQSTFFHCIYFPALTSSSNMSSMFCTNVKDSSRFPPNIAKTPASPSSMIMRMSDQMSLQTTGSWIATRINSSTLVLRQAVLRITQRTREIYLCVAGVLSPGEMPRMSSIWPSMVPSDCSAMSMSCCSQSSADWACCSR